MARRSGFAARDQEISSFGPILARLCDRAHLIGAVLVDSEGEAVDYAGTLQAFDLKVMAAEWRNVFDQARVTTWPGVFTATEMTVRAAGKSFVLYALAEGYALVLQLPKRCFGVSRRAIWEALREVSGEAGLPLPQGWMMEKWEAVEVKESSGRRPTALWFEGGWVPLEVLGAFSSESLSRREHGYLVRLPDGAELTLVRERLGHWFADTASKARF